MKNTEESSKKPLDHQDKPKKAIHLNRDQSRAFIKKAREIGADEERSDADELLGRLARNPPEPRAKKTHQ